MSAAPLRSEPAFYRLSVRVTDAELRAVRALARAQRLTVSAMVGEALAEMAGDLGESRPVAWRAQSCKRCKHRRRASCPTHPGE